MDKTPLVDSDVKVGNQIVSVLAAGRIELEDALWVYSPQIEEWRLILSTPLVDQKGSRDAYLTVLNLLERAGVQAELPLRRMSVLSPRDSFLRDVRVAFSLPAPSGFRPGRPIGNYVFDEAYVYGGSLHIVRFEDHGRRPDTYRVIFAPYRGAGGAAPSLDLTGQDQLNDFLVNKVGLNSYTVGKALSELQLNRTTSIPDVHVGTNELKRWGLLPRASVRSQQAR
jgi:hypothetical protein